MQVDFPYSLKPPVPKPNEWIHTSICAFRSRVLLSIGGYLRSRCAPQGQHKKHRNEIAFVYACHPAPDVSPDTQPDRPDPIGVATELAARLATTAIERDRPAATRPQSANGSANPACSRCRSRPLSAAQARTGRPCSRWSASWRAPTARWPTSSASTTCSWPASPCTAAPQQQRRLLTRHRGAAPVLGQCPQSAGPAHHATASRRGLRARWRQELFVRLGGSRLADHLGLGAQRDGALIGVLPKRQRASRCRPTGTPSASARPTAATCTSTRSPAGGAGAAGAGPDAHPAGDPAFAGGATDHGQSVPGHRPRRLRGGPHLHQRAGARLVRVRRRRRPAPIP